MIAKILKLTPALLVVVAFACTTDDGTNGGDGDGDGDGDDTTTCATGQTACSGGCAEVMSDPANCGACGTTCDAGLFCSAGMCTSACAAGETACGSSCANIDSNPSHCGGCNISCSAGQTCTAGSCTGDTTGSGGGTGTGGAGSGGTGSGGTASGGSTTVSEGPCDIYGDAGTPCAAAYSTIRRLKSDYTGPLYQIRVGSSQYNIGGERVTNYESAEWSCNGAKVGYTTTPEVGTLVNIPQTADGFADASVQEENCPLGTTCTVSLLYDQSGNGTDLPVANGGLCNGGTWAALDNFETVMDDRAAMTVGGHDVYALRMEARQGYRIEEVGEGMPIDEEPQGMYMLADGTRVGGACCWDFGNVTTNPASYAEMNTLFFGEAYWGDGNNTPDHGPPWFGADFEAGVWMGGSYEGDPGWGELNASPSDRPPNLNNPSMKDAKFALGFLKTDDDEDNTYALRMANILTASSVTEAYRGRYPKLSYANPHGTDNRGAVVLGVGGDNSNNSFSTFYEGAIVAGFPSDEAELAVMQNIQAVGYSQ